jgi:hypothetical protein
MVNFVVVSAYDADSPAQPGRVKIAGGPLYDLARVQAIVTVDGQLLAWTQKCRKDVYNLFDADLDAVADLVCSLQASDYIDSEWCENGQRAIAACDAYRLRRLERMPSTGKTLPVTYFLKFAIGKTGRVVLMMSCHV